MLKQIYKILWFPWIRGKKSHLFCSLYLHNNVLNGYWNIQQEKKYRHDKDTLLSFKSDRMEDLSLYVWLFLLMKTFNKHKIDRLIPNFFSNLYNIRALSIASIDAHFLVLYIFSKSLCIYLVKKKKEYSSWQYQNWVLRTEQRITIFKKANQSTMQHTAFFPCLILLLNLCYIISMLLIGLTSEVRR